ncbi:MAG: peptidoglycan-binding protein [Clostridia bacterium]|nr:peptidoglycan-binding protein [Clostridia bacterium]
MKRALILILSLLLLLGGIAEEDLALRLNELGYVGTGALTAFQTANGLPVTGEFDAATVALLTEGEPITRYDYLTALNADLVPLAPGESGPAVTTLQRRLNALGYTESTADGVYGEDTRAAVMRFQRMNGLAETGVADLSVLIRLETAEDFAVRCAACSCAPGDSGPNVFRLQRRLQALDWFNGSVTGVYGENTARAVARYQRDAALEPTGIADAATLEMLYYDNADHVLDDEEHLIARLGALGWFGDLDFDNRRPFLRNTLTAFRLTGWEDPFSDSAPTAAEADFTHAAMEFARADLVAAAHRLLGRPMTEPLPDAPGFLFLQTCAVKGGIPLLASDNLDDLWTAVDIADVRAGDVLKLRLSHDGEVCDRLAVATSDSAAAYTEGGYVVESPLDILPLYELYSIPPEALF